MQRCATCKWWGELIYSPPWQKPPYEHRLCGLVKSDPYESNSAVYTLATFGCVLHEPKGTNER